MKYNRVYSFTEEELEKLGVNFKLWELCKYQQSIIDTYKEYIEKEFVRPNPKRFRVKTAEEMENRK